MVGRLLGLSFVLRKLDDAQLAQVADWSCLSVFCVELS